MLLKALTFHNERRCSVIHQWCSTSVGPPEPKQSTSCLICPDQCQEGPFNSSQSAQWHSEAAELLHVTEVCCARINIYEADVEVLSGFMFHYHIYVGGAAVGSLWPLCFQSSVIIEPVCPLT